MDRFLYRLATLFGIGKLPRAPGTWGSLAALIIAVPLLHYITWPIFIGLTAVLFMLGIAAADVYAKKTGEEDSPKVVIDELVGQWIALFPLALVVPFGDLRWAALLTFVLFRALDILKPWPIRRLEKKPGGGLSVMLDDAVAGIMAAALLYLVGIYL
ncbi:MAG: phosphatidylglycerophosphatase A [Proteobacteria bacterium]|nr:phosphatidylglycerophosphatase A [Pseudomonadota bacterium]